MDRVEGAAHQRDRAGPGRQSSSRHGLPLELLPPDANGVAGRDAGAQLRVDAEACQVALESLGRLLDIEVGLRRQPLDLLATDTEAAVLALDHEVVAEISEPVDHDARRLGSGGQLLGGRQQVGDAFAEGGQALAARRRQADDRDAIATPGRPERRPRFRGGRQIELVGADQDRLLKSCGSWAWSSSRMTA